VRNEFFKIGGCRGVPRGERLFDFDWAVPAVTAATTARDSAEVGLLRLRENAAQLHANEPRGGACAKMCALRKSGLTQVGVSDAVAAKQTSNRGALMSGG